jgi:hypothetical protein
METDTRVVIPGESCSTGRCVEWRTGPCEATCAAFLGAKVVAVTGCEPPEPNPNNPAVMTVECRYVEQYKTCDFDLWDDCGNAFPGAGGRPQSGRVVLGPLHGTDPIGRHFAFAAEAEESSVHAFRELARALGAFHAPDSLVTRCRAAAKDESRHRRVMTRLARAHGVEPSRASASPSNWNALSALTMDNAVAGCVDELWSAALTVYAALFANAPEQRTALASVARDEAGHAALSADLHAHLVARLDPDDVHAVEHARGQAIDRLRRYEALHHDEALVTAGLLPPPHIRAALLAALFGRSGSDRSMRCAA